MNKSILIVVAGNTFPAISHDQGDFGDWIARGLGPALPTRQIDARWDQPLPELSQLAGVVVSGSHEMVTTRAAWSEALAAWLKRCVEARVPVLGICYGHQLLAYACGGTVGFREDGIEIGTVGIECLDDARTDPLFAATPRTFPAQVVHQQAVTQLPDGATLLARSEAEPVQAFRIGQCAWGVQFHPEFSREAMRGYIMESRQPDTDALLGNLTETPEAASLLQTFASHAADTGKH